jgi:uncharacterized repeat protein (TIGR03806 family)
MPGAGLNRHCAVPQSGVQRCLTVLCWFALSALALGADPLVRVPNTTLRMPAHPPTQGFATQNAFPGLAFDEPVAVATAPGETNRLFVCERGGRILVITNLAAPTASVFLDLSARVTHGVFNDPRGLLSVAFHPGFASNRWFYVFFTTADGGVPQKRVARFEVSQTNPHQALAASEQVIFAQPSPSNAHKGGDLCFGPDGYLYISLGDGSNGDDLNNHGQRIDRDFFSAILRVDVDARPGSLPPHLHPSVPSPANYAVPPDNPFVGATNFNGAPVNPAQVRTEFWAVGLRNPWRLRFDPATGALLCGDVGESQREELNVIVRGGNYGWPFREGTLPGPKAAPAGFSSLPPLLEYGHGFNTNQGNSVIGGVVYRGDRLAQLTGRYVFADYTSGNLWAFPIGAPAPALELLADDRGLTGFALDPRNGEVLMTDVNEGVIKRLVYNSTVTGAPLPPTLAATGVFTNLLTLTPHAGIVPYDLNVPFWSDHALKSRWFSVPATNFTLDFSPEANWSFPTGAVWIKHFELMTNTATQARARIETRLLVKNSNGVYGVTYRWGGSPTNAALVDEGGLNETFIIHDAGLLRTQVWRYPSRNECLACHTAAAGGAIGFHTAQLNRDFAYPTATTNQIAALAAAGYFTAPPTNRHALPALAAATDTTVSREFRVRSYLAANCAHCHRPGGAGGGWDARLSTPTAATGLIDGALDNNAGNAAMRIVKPGSVALSMLHQRLLGAGPGRMPPLATTELDTAALDLMAAWITNDLAARVDFGAWQTNHFGGTNSPSSAALADPDADGAVNYLEYLTGSVPHAAGDGWRTGIQWSGGAPAVTFLRPANRATEVQFTTNTTPPFAWRFLDVPANRPFFPVTNEPVAVPDPDHGPAPRLYRVRVREP